jgi:hypothetical protein
MNSIVAPAVFAPLQTRVRAPRAAARATPVTCSARKAPVARAARTTKPAVSEEVRGRASRKLVRVGRVRPPRAGLSIAISSAAAHLQSQLHAHTRRPVVEGPILPVRWRAHGTRACLSSVPPSSIQNQTQLPPSRRSTGLHAPRSWGSGFRCARDVSPLTGAATGVVVYGAVQCAVVAGGCRVHHIHGPCRGSARHHLAD